MKVCIPVLVCTVCMMPGEKNDCPKLGFETRRLNALSSELHVSAACDQTSLLHMYINYDLYINLFFMNFNCSKLKLCSGPGTCRNGSQCYFRHVDPEGLTKKLKGEKYYPIIKR